MFQWMRQEPNATVNGTLNPNNYGATPQHVQLSLRPADRLIYDVGAGGLGKS